jgi:uncharacterized SAM-binding protein YcdF (DUF218 family)
MFHLKKIVSHFLSPFLLCVLLVLVGLGLLWFSRRQTLGKVLATVGAVFLFLFAYEPVADLVVRPLEVDYVPLVPTETQRRDVKWVVVLGGGHTSSPTLPPTTQLGESARARLVEGVRLHRLLPESRLLFSGAALYDRVPHAEVMAAAAEALGVPRDRMVVDASAEDTADEATALGRVVGEDPFVLVTSAWHMRRATALFAKRGLSPIPGPADYEVKPDNGLDPFDLFPKPSRLTKLESAVREYVGRLVSWGRGQL